MATTATSSLPSGIVKYEDYQAQQKAKPTNENMGQTEFLTLFTTQLKNQNPLDPVKNEAFVAQLAQFSQLEATTAMKTSMQNLVSSLANDRLLGATSLIGKTVGVPDGPVMVTDTTVSQGVVNAPT
ncbi:flagellar hook capping FlgD N-terminal domain-containing protein, partial [Limnohabitans sp.]